MPVCATWGTCSRSLGARSHVDASSMLGNQKRSITWVRDLKQRQGAAGLPSAVPAAAH